VLSLKFLFWSLPLLRRRSKTFMSDGATRYHTSRKGQAYFYAMALVLILFVGIVTFGYKQFELLFKQNVTMSQQVTQLKGDVQIYPGLAETVEQNRLLLKQNADLVRDLLAERHENDVLEQENRALKRRIGIIAPTQ